MKTICLYPDRRPDLMDDYVRLTGFTKEEILEKCHDAIGRGSTPVFEVDVPDEEYDKLRSWTCEIPWTNPDGTVVVNTGGEN